MNEITSRYCGSCGWLGIWLRDGREIYRTGRHFPTAGEAMARVQKFIAEAK